MQRHDFEYDGKTPYQRSHTSGRLAWMFHVRRPLMVMVAYHIHEHVR